MDGCGNVLLILLALVMLMPGFCLVQNGLGSIPAIFAGNFSHIATSASSLLLGIVFVTGGIALFSRIGKPGGDGEE